MRRYALGVPSATAQRSRLKVGGRHVLDVDAFGRRDRAPFLAHTGILEAKFDIALKESHQPYPHLWEKTLSRISGHDARYGLPQPSANRRGAIAFNALRTEIRVKESATS